MKTMTLWWTADKNSGGYYEISIFVDQPSRDKKGIWISDMGPLVDPLDVTEGETYFRGFNPPDPGECRKVEFPWEEE